MGPTPLDRPVVDMSSFMSSIQGGRGKVVSLPAGLTPPPSSALSCQVQASGAEHQV